MRNIFKDKKRPSSKKSTPKKVSKSANLTDLQNLARRHGMRFAGLTKRALIEELKTYGFIEKS